MYRNVMLILLILHWMDTRETTAASFSSFLTATDQQALREWDRTQKGQYWMEEGYPTITFLNFVAALFEKNYQPTPPSTLRIPKIIHQIWLGNPIPTELLKLQATWKSLPGWEYKLWTEKEIDALNLVNRELYDNAPNYGEKSDVARYEILLKYGGLYVDFDCACLQQELLEQLNCAYDFYMGLEPFEFFCIIGNAVIGSIAQHPLLQTIINELPAWHSRVYKFCQRTDIPTWAATCMRTGPGYVSNILWRESAQTNYNAIILPPTFFYPGLFPSTTFYSEFTCIHHYFNATWVPR